jgi:hypothetical protein
VSLVSVSAPRAGAAHDSTVMVTRSIRPAMPTTLTSSDIARPVPFAPDTHEGNAVADRLRPPVETVVSAVIFRTVHACSYLLPRFVGARATVRNTSLRTKLHPNDVVCTVIGVMPPDMKFPSNNDVWMPFSQLPVQVRESSAASARCRPSAVWRRRHACAGARRNRPHSEKLARDFPDTNKDARPSLMKFNDRIAGGPIRRCSAAFSGSSPFTGARLPGERPPEVTRSVGSG